MGLKYTKRAMTSYEVHRFFHGLEVSFFPDTFCFYFLETNAHAQVYACAFIFDAPTYKQQKSVEMVNKNSTLFW